MDELEELKRLFCKVLQINDGCIHCKYWIPKDPGDCKINWCKNRSKYELDIDKVKEDYEIE